MKNSRCFNLLCYYENTVIAITIYTGYNYFNLIFVVVLQPNRWSVNEDTAS